MFTGLIQEVGVVKEVSGQGEGLRLSLEAPGISRKVKLGDSVSVNGCCLTVVAVTPPRVEFEAVPETLRRTLFGLLRKGDSVNLEMPLTLEQPLGGHFVQGHVDGVAQILELKPEGQGFRMRARVPEALVPYIVEKGSVALDGISLTVAVINNDEIEVALIPHTLQNTCLRFKKVDDYLQVEVDILAKYVEKLSAGYRNERKNP